MERVSNHQYDLEKQPFLSHTYDGAILYLAFRKVSRLQRFKRMGARRNGMMPMKGRPEVSTLVAADDLVLRTGFSVPPRRYISAATPA